MKDKESKMSAEKNTFKKGAGKRGCLPYDWFVL